MTVKSQALPKVLPSAIIDLTRPLCPTTTPPTIYPGDPPFQITPHATVKKDGYSVHALHLGTHTSTHIDAPAHFVEGGRTIDEVPLDELVGPALVVDLSTLNLRPRQKIEWDDLERAWINQTQATTHDNVTVMSTEPTGGGFQAKILAESIASGGYKMLLVHTGWDASLAVAASSSESDATPHFFDHPYFASSIANRLMSPSGTSTIRVFGSDTPNPDETPFNDVGGLDGYSFHEVWLGSDRLIVENLTNLDRLVSQKSPRGGDNDRGEVWTVTIVPLKIVGVDGSPVRAFASR